MEINSIKPNNVNFGMAIKSTSKAEKIMQKYLTLKDVKQIAELVELEKSNPVDVYIGTKVNYMGRANQPVEMWTPCDSLIVSIEDKIFEPNSFMFLFSSSKCIVSAIKKGVKYAQELAEKRNMLKDIEKTTKN